MAPEREALRPRPMAGVAADTEYAEALRPRPIAGVVADIQHTTRLREFLVEGVDRCVKCGLCLPYCPTYLVTRNEVDSPRGRLSLMAALAQDQLRADATLTTHLDQCLHCLRCQRACPAEVGYAGLIDGAKELLRAEKALAPPPWWLRQLLDHALLRRAAAVLVNLWRRSGGARLPVLSGYTAMLPQAAGRGRPDNEHDFADGELPQAPAHEHARPNNEHDFADGELPQTPTHERERQDDEPGLADSGPAAARKRTPQAAGQDGGRGEVLLFTGCVAEITDRETLHDARQLLQAAGFAVRLPQGRTCCGALDQHAGDPRRAQRFKEQNLKAFGGTAPIISCATGCGAHWRGYGGDAARRHFDILDFLCGAGQNALQKLSFASLAAPQTVALHTPCTQVGTRASGRVSAAKALLARVPGLDLADLPDRTGCCGAAGLHLLRQSGMGARLIADKIEALEAMNVKTLLTTNVGCAMHFRRALHARGLAVAVLHPVSLLRRQLTNAANTENNR